MTGRRPGTVRPVLAMVESNTTGTGRAFATAARARGLRPVLLSARPERYRRLVLSLPKRLLGLPRYERLRRKLLGESPTQLVTHPST